MERQRLDAVFLLILVILDLVVLTFSLPLAYKVRFEILSKIDYFYVGKDEIPQFFPYYLVINFVLVILWIFLLLIYRVYNTKNLFSYQPIINVITLGLFLVSSLSFFYRGFSYSRLVFIFTWGIAVLFTFLFRIILHIIRISFLGRKPVRVLIIGNNEFAKTIIDSGGRESYAKFDLIDKKHLEIDELGKFIDERGIQEIIITERIEDDKLLKLISFKRKKGISIKVVPESYLLFSKKLVFDQVSGVPLLEIEFSALESYQGYLKEIMDIVLGTLGLIVFSPFFLIISILIKLDSEGPVFYKHLRVGRYGKPFYLWKFRTMYKDADKILESHPELKKEFEKEFKLKNDPRVTRVGRFLRKFSLDEIPQIFNILKGEMSVVGPRPVTFKELEKYGRYAEEILRVKPGLTGLWQVSGRSDVDYSQRVKFDLYYIQNWSILLDIEIILKTIPSVFFGKGAY